MKITTVYTGMGIFFFFFFFFFAVLGFELRASHLVGRCSTPWATPPVPYFYSLWVFSNVAKHEQKGVQFIESLPVSAWIDCFILFKRHYSTMK
jgi:hypothetical protein